MTDSRSIGESALHILCTEGTPRLTMSRVASALGVRSQTLYHHVRGLPDLIDAAREVLIAQIDLSCLAPDVPFERAVTQFAERYATAFRPLAREIWVFFQHPINDASTIQMYERFLVRALAEGIPESRALKLMLDVEYALFMVIFEHASLKEILALDALNAHDAPALARAIANIPSETWEGSRARLHERVRELVGHACSSPE